MSSKTNAREVEILQAVQGALYDAPGALPVARGLSHFGEHALGWIALSAFGSACNPAKRKRNKRRKWVALGVGAFTAHAASVVLKRVVRRRRPHDPAVKIGVSTPSNFSFPSSHATSTSAAMVHLADITGSKLPLVGVPIMMLSRMVLGVHYPSDTLAGALLGAGVARATIEIERQTRD